ncbi:hypothetical protein BDV33DRAFT_168865 [Aspergillus novoparasiticus]|uniref:Secreted protein n=1 Tax=Aspergillus novoparasiticus TaxID=986946 RepID=A0A5N6F0D2_9EURO|nr:hypothetical protein BDV33DRAFT_168865 [Aspergillus novoparasiticus]
MARLRTVSRGCGGRLALCSFWTIVTSLTEAPLSRSIYINSSLRTRHSLIWSLVTSPGHVKDSAALRRAVSPPGLLS